MIHAVICYRRSSSNQRGRVGDFIDDPRFGELIYKGKVYGPDDAEQFNADAKRLSVDGVFYAAPYVKMVEVEEPKVEKPVEKSAPAKKAPAKKAATKKAK